MNNLVFETKTFLQTIRVFGDRIEIKEPLRVNTLSISSVASVDTGFSPSYDSIIRTIDGKKHKLLVKSKDKQALKDAIFTAKDSLGTLNK